MTPRVYYSPLMRVPAENSEQGRVDAVEEPQPTPPTVRDVSPSVCLSLVDFKDDGVTLRLNRSYARSRDDGTSAPPSLLQQHDKRFSSASALDLGKSTYASGSNSVCTAFWRELLDVWTHREDTIRYCIAVSQAARPKAPSNNPDDRLDMDRVVPPAEPSTWSRAENPIDFTERQLRNELAIESIIRRRSLEGMCSAHAVFKSRCRAFEPTPSDTVEGKREQAYWEGK